VVEATLLNACIVVESVWILLLDTFDDLVDGFLALMRDEFQGVLLLLGEFHSITPR